MALRTLIATHECVQEYERAAREHQDAGLILLADGRAQGVALMALLVEMVLKSAYFRFIGYAATQQIASADLRAAVLDKCGCFCPSAWCSISDAHRDRCFACGQCGSNGHSG